MPDPCGAVRNASCNRAGGVEGGYRVATFYVGIAPYAAIQAQSFRGYSETDLTAGGFAIGYNARTASDTRSELASKQCGLHSWGGRQR